VEMSGPKPPEFQPAAPANIPGPPPTGTSPHVPVSEEEISS
jgi:hypothetical protein